MLKKYIKTKKNMTSFFEIQSTTVRRISVERPIQVR